jgi:4-amino-4-deoxy-L-arabinose transferase-like glycosyltransferase
MKPQPTASRRERSTALAFLGTALLLRLGFVMVFIRNAGNDFRVDDYYDLAVGILTHGEFAKTAGIPAWTCPPFFPLWIAGFFRIFGQKPLAVFLANVVLSAATGWLIYRLARRRFNPRTALIFLGLWAVYPYSVYYCGWMYRESIFTFQMALMLTVLDRWFEEGGLKWASWAGVSGAMIALMNPSGLLFVAAAPVGLLLARRSLSVWRAAACFGLVAALVYSPWVIRNQLAFGSPLLTNVHGPMNLYYGLVIPNDALGTEREAEIKRADPVENVAATLIYQGHFVEGANVYRAAARRLIAADPARYVRQCLARVVKYWRPVPYRRAYPYGYAKIFWTSLLSDGLLIPLGFIGLWLCRRRWAELLPFYLLVLFLPLAYYLTYTVIRFRMPVMPVMILAAAHVIDRLLKPGIGIHD